MTTLSFDILARDRASKAFQSAGSSAGGFSKHIGGLLKAAGGLIAAKLGVDALSSFVNEARESEKVSRITANAIRATGGVANVTAKQVGDLATAISNKTGIDDEQVQTASNMLLTFKNIRNEVGRGNDVFNRATQAAADLSIQFGGMDGASKQLGKALNDPVKGISALSRAGVTFTEQQKEQIRTLVASGKTLEAQKIILAEIESQVGGAAAAAADPMQKLGVIVGNLKERIGLALLPVVERLASWLGRVMPKVLDKVARGFSAFKSAFSGEGITSNGWVGALERIGVTAGRVVENVRLFWDALRTGFTEDEGTPIESFALLLREHVLPVIREVVGWLRDHWQAALIGAGVAFLALTSPISLVVAAVVAAWLKFEVFRDVVETVARFLVEKVAPAVSAFAEGVIEQFSNAVEWVKQVWPQISEAVSHVMNVVAFVVGAVLAQVQFLWETYGATILSLVTTVWNTIKGVIDGALTVVRGIIQTVLALINGDWGKAWEGIKLILSGVWETIKAIVGGAIGVVKDLIVGALMTVAAGWSATWNGFTDVVSAVWEAIKKATGDAVDWVKKKIDDMLGPLDEVIGKVGKIGGKVGGGIGGLVGKIPGFDDGGIVPGPIGMPQLAVVHGGETVVPTHKPGAGLDPDDFGRRAARAFAAQLKAEMRTA